MDDRHVHHAARRFAYHAARIPKKNSFFHKKKRVSYDNSNPAPAYIAVRNLAFIVSSRLKLGNFKTLKHVDAVGNRCTSFTSPNVTSAFPKDLRLNPVHRNALCGS
jgi:hypothetical protein